MLTSRSNHEKSNEEHSRKTKLIVNSFFLIKEFRIFLKKIMFLSYKCDGQCAIEMLCPTDLIFDNKNQRCEWVSQQFRMASLKADETLSKILMLKNNNPRMVTLAPPLSVNSTNLETFDFVPSFSTSSSSSSSPPPSPPYSPLLSSNFSSSSSSPPPSPTQSPTGSPNIPTNKLFN